MPPATLAPLSGAALLAETAHQLTAAQRAARRGVSWLTV